ncbi:hypothetical protein HELRODRAFT_188398 [Helobdella robusta]|uniref:Apple domain-containing protein n=1 Tax=Helobdella robusta TaxID=6412 RepID=T1FPY2_HELRO|nr:hypothetical protein HELRODRAFT_188398 [Helobdella robusta]ESO06572.1 hypothetical protein HELRODRAFT_188398 [Helobdella robusta]
MLKLVAFWAMLVALQLISGVRWGKECWYESAGRKMPDDAADLIPGATSVEACKKHCLETDGCLIIQVVDGNKCYMEKIGAHFPWKKLLEDQPNVVYYQNCREIAPDE